MTDTSDRSDKETLLKHKEEFDKQVDEFEAELRKKVDSADGELAKVTLVLKELATILEEVVAIQDRMNDDLISLSKANMEIVRRVATHEVRLNSILPARRFCRCGAELSYKTKHALCDECRTN